MNILFLYHVISTSKFEHRVISSDLIKRSQTAELKEGRKRTTSQKTADEKRDTTKNIANTVIRSGKSPMKLASGDRQREESERDSPITRQWSLGQTRSTG